LYVRVCERLRCTVLKKKKKFPPVKHAVGDGFCPTISRSFKASVEGRMDDALGRRPSRRHLPPPCVLSNTNGLCPAPCSPTVATEPGYGIMQFCLLLCSSRSPSVNSARIPYHILFFLLLARVLCTYMHAYTHDCL
jgi:hypothetical protein